MPYQFYKLDAESNEKELELLELGNLVTPAVRKQIKDLHGSIDLRISICKNECTAVRQYEPFPFWMPVGSDDAILVQNETNICLIELEKLKQQAIDLITVQKNRNLWSQLYDKEQYPDIRQKIIDQVIEPLFNRYHITQVNVDEEGLKEIFIHYSKERTCDSSRLSIIERAMRPIVKEWEKQFTSLPVFVVGFLAWIDFSTKVKANGFDKWDDLIKSLENRISAMNPFESNKFQILLDFFEKIGKVPESERNDYIVTEILKLDRKGKLNYRQLIPGDMLPALRVVEVVSTETSEGESFWF